MRIPDKPFKNYEEQLDILWGRNLKYENKNNAIHILKQVPYYSLINGYKKDFLDVERSRDSDERYIEGTTIELLYTIYDFDSKLKNILFRYILGIETNIKGILTYFISENIGVFEDEYLDRKNYPPNNRYATPCIRTFNKYLLSKDDPINYYAKTKNHIPPWILASELSFYDTLRWISSLSLDQQNELHLNLFDNFKISLPVDKLKTQNLFFNSAHLLRKFRNRCAHGHRAINTTISRYRLNKRFVNSLCNFPIISKNKGKNDLFAIFIAVILLLNDEQHINNFLIDIQTLFASHPDEIEVIMNLSNFKADDFYNLRTFIEKLYGIKVKLLDD